MSNILTPTQVHILNLRANNYSDEQIAKVMNINNATLKLQYSTIRVLLGVRTNCAAIKRLSQDGLIVQH